MRSRTTALNRLGARFDGLLARMQSPKAKKRMADAFGASPAKLGRAAVKAVGGKRSPDRLKRGQQRGFS